MRGTESNHVKVLIDGIDAGNPGNPAGAFDFAHLLAGDIERIEVIRGPAGAVWGANAVNGVVNIISKTAKETQGWFVTGGGGTANERAVDVQINRLRRKIESDPANPLFLQAVRGIGYRLVASP